MMQRVFRLCAAAALLPLSAFGADQAAAVPAAPPASAGGLFQVLFGLVVVLGLLAGAAWILKRLGARQGMGSSVIKVVGGVSVGGRERVVVVEAADQWIVVGVAPGSVNALATLPKQESLPVQAGLPGAPGGPFAAWLKQTIDKRNGR